MNTHIQLRSPGRREIQCLLLLKNVSDLGCFQHVRRGGYFRRFQTTRGSRQKCTSDVCETFCGFCLLHLLSIEDIMSIYIELHRHDGYHIAPPPKMYRFQFFVDVKEVVFVGNLLQKQSRYTITFKKDEHILRSESTTFLEGSNLF